MTITPTAVISNEKRRADFGILMDDNDIKARELSTYTGIHESTISKLRTGKEVITEKTWAILLPAIRNIIVKHKQKADEDEAKEAAIEPEKKIEIPAHLTGHLDNFGNCLVSKSIVGKRPKLFLKILKEKGYECTLEPSSDNDWLVQRKAHESKSVEESILSQPVIITPTAIEPVEPILTIGKPAQEDLIIKSTVASIDEQRACILRIIERNETILENIDALGFTTAIERIQRDQPILYSLVAALGQKPKVSDGFDDYEEKFMNTIDGINPKKFILNGILGISDGSANLIRSYMESTFHGHPVESNEIREELGTVLWCCTIIAKGLGLKLSDIAQQAID